jgi:hypothetical protein
MFEILTDTKSGDRTNIFWLGVWNPLLTSMITFMARLSYITLLKRRMHWAESYPCAMLFSKISRDPTGYQQSYPQYIFGYAKSNMAIGTRVRASRL